MPCPPPRDLPDPGIEQVSPLAPALVGRCFATEPPGKHIYLIQRVETLQNGMCGVSKSTLTNFPLVLETGCSKAFTAQKPTKTTNRLDVRHPQQCFRLPDTVKTKMNEGDVRMAELRNGSRG